VKRTIFPWLLPIVLTACAGTPSRPGETDTAPPATSAEPSEPSGGGHAEPPSPAAECPTAKLRFTHETGCLNDGSVEFCLPAGDDALLAQVLAIAPTVHSTGGGGGRAGCSAPTEQLYFLPTTGADCVVDHGAMTDKTWEQVCRIAALPEIREIVPTWFE
jgi:hypothetical protein